MRLVMMGTGTFAEPVFQALLARDYSVVGLVTQPDRTVGQERGSTRQTGIGMKEIALAKGIPVFQPVSVNMPEGVAGVQAFQPDLLVVAAYGQILSKDVLAAAPQGGINVHASLLPKYRGAAPVAWAIANGETRTGVTIIRMSIHLDAGEMLAQEAIDIGAEETAGELEARLSPHGARLAIRVIDQIAAGTAHGITQDKAQVTKAPKLTKEHGQIDWTRHARDVCNHIRAMQPWPTAYSWCHEHGHPPLRVIIQKATWAEHPATDSLSPGDVIVAAESLDRLRIAAEAGTLVEVLELQPAGKRRMAAAELLRGHRLRAGDRFGPEAS